MAKMKKTTIELDESKLLRIMKMTGILTRREAIDFALEQAERIAKSAKVFEGDFFVSEKERIVAPDYDVQKLRRMETPK